MNSVFFLPSGGPWLCGELTTKKNVSGMINFQLLQRRKLSGQLSSMLIKPRPQFHGAPRSAQTQAAHTEITPIAWSTSEVGIQSSESSKSENLIKQIKEKLVNLSDGEISLSAYDTAWVARIRSEVDPDKPQFPMSLDWVRKNQFDDGSWGDIYYFLYDRLVNTLACVLVLKIWKTGEEQILKGLQYLRENVKKLEKESKRERTVGFELVFPWMLNEAKHLGLQLPYDLPCLQEFVNLREEKIKRIPLETLHSTYTSLLFSLEGLQDVVSWDQIMKHQSRDGSFLSSPAATAVAYMHTRDKRCLDFLTTYTRRFGGAVPCTYPIDVLERIFAVDTMEKLGIDRHFQEEISDMLDYVYKHTTKQGTSWGRDNRIPDIDDTCVALRILRSHGYPVSPDVLENFRDEDDGNFICFPGESHRGVSDMFNLYRCTQVAFPGEKILKEARTFLEEYLTNSVNNNALTDKWSPRKSLAKEVVRALNFPWRTRFNRLEVREYIDHYGEQDVWIAKNIYWMYAVNNPWYLELAKLDYNHLLCLYNKEANSIVEWWNAYGFEHQYLVDKMGPREVHFAIAATLYEPEFSISRVVYTKLNLLENLLSHLYKQTGSDHDLTLFSQAVEQWDPQLAMSLPASLKAIFIAIYDTLSEVAEQINNAQGRDMFTYWHRLRVQQIEHYKKRRELKSVKSEISFHDHMEGFQRDLGVAIRVVPPMFLLGEKLRRFEIKSLDENSIIQNHLVSFLALFIGIHKYKNMGADQEEPNAIYLWEKEKTCTEQEAFTSLCAKMDEEFDELVHEVLKPGLASRNCRRLILEHARIVQYFKRSEELKDVTEKNNLINSDMARMFTPIE